MYTCFQFRKDFKFHKVGGTSSADSGVNKPVMRGFTPPFKQPLPTSNLASSYRPQSGLTPATSLTTCSIGSRSLSDQTVRSKSFTSSSRLSLPHGTKSPQEPPLHASCVPPRREKTPSKPCSLTNSLDGGQQRVTSGGSVQKSNPPVAFVAPVVSKPTITR